MIKKIAFSSALFVLLTVSSFAQDVDDISPSRPDQSESPVIVPKEFLQVETGGTYEYDRSILSDGSDIKTKTYTFPSTLIRYGITKNVELRLAADYTYERSAADVITPSQPSPTFKISGISPVGIGTKIHLLDEDRIAPETAVLFSLALPLFHDDFNPPHLGGEILLAMANTLTKKIDLSYDLGMMWDGEGSTPTGLYTLSLGIDIVKRLSMFVEAYGFVQKKETPDHRLDGGFSYLIAKNVMADFSGGIGITGKSPDYFIGAGLSFRLPK